MADFNFMTRPIAIDLGTANFLILQDDKIVVDEPAVVAFCQGSGRVIAIGRSHQCQALDWLLEDK
jgi:rod shape-determining protein MreB and related proteins